MRRTATILNVLMESLPVPTTSVFLKTNCAMVSTTVKIIRHRMKVMKIVQTIVHVPEIISNVRTPIYVSNLIGCAMAITIAVSLLSSLRPIWWNVLNISAFAFI